MLLAVPGLLAMREGLTGNHPKTHFGVYFDEQTADKIGVVDFQYLFSECKRLGRNTLVPGPCRQSASGLVRGCFKDRRSPSTERAARSASRAPRVGNPMGISTPRTDPSGVDWAISNSVSAEIARSKAPARRTIAIQPRFHPSTPTDSSIFVAILGSGQEYCVLSAVIFPGARSRNEWFSSRSTPSVGHRLPDDSRVGDGAAAVRTPRSGCDDRPSRE